MKLSPVLVYTVLRLLAFLVPFGVMMLFPIFREFYWLAAIFAALIGLSISLLFLRRPLSDVSRQVEKRRAANVRTDRDEDVEDAAADAASRPEPTGTDER
ncbi:mechanosensitive ion channel protein MscS [Microbacterium sp. Root61]|uniref:DUF4229 domain-containing protein n=1 Tax=Microbacterium sp. Root61 TaxID=1736570 RepID=UPI0006F5EB86|nr:DUF4229 domain-containing protein [Microbacterium sp. Root61]KRA24357.1 mechanosensitive ion channel protein MscS [Microbacterium sp. Root61]